jgi:hypothetical protein
VVRGQADYGALAPKETAGSVSDMGEIAARLGSIVTYDKRGDVVDFDNFEEPLIGWSASTTGTGGYIRLSSENFKSGCQSICLFTGTPASKYAYIFGGDATLGVLRLGIEISFSQLTEMATFTLSLQQYTGTTFSTGAIMIDGELHKIYLYTLGGVWTEIADIATLISNKFIFNTLKLVVDFSALKYVRALLNSIEFDLSAHDLESYPNTYEAHTQFEAGLMSKDVLGASVYLDDCVLTQAEP